MRLFEELRKFFFKQPQNIFYSRHSNEFTWEEIENKISIKMKKTISSVFILILIAGTLVSCNPNSKNSKEANRQSATKVEHSDPMPSWNDGEIKADIIEFVKNATNKNTTGFIPVENRIAVFDNDGTMWSEQPFYFQYYFSLYLLQQMAPQHPEWKTEEPYKSLLEKGDKAFAEIGSAGLTKLLFTTNTGQTITEYQHSAIDWMTNSKHPTKNVVFSTLFFQPMIELLNYLKANGFQNYIVSGGTSEFMRPIICDIYGIPKNHILGSYFKTKYKYNNGNPIINRLPEFEVYNDKAKKVELIQQIIGLKPVFCGGNSDGDLAMMQWTASNTYKSMMLYIHHTDATREWAYDRNSHIGTFNKGFDEALKKGWLIMDMKNDWKTIYTQ